MNEVKSQRDRLIDMLTTLQHHDIEPQSLHLDRRGLTVWITRRTEFELVVEAIGLTSRESDPRQHGQREFYAHEGKQLLDTPLLIQCTSFTHHDDWQPR
jgi:hypothetical protein